MGNSIRTVSLALALLVAPAAFAGDPAAGEQAYTSKGCVGCHGVGGASRIPANPKLTGRDAAYISEQLKAFRSGARENAIMGSMAKLLSPQDVENIAAYIGAQSQ